MTATGVIIGVDRGLTEDSAYRLRQELTAVFPGVRFALVAGSVGMVAFGYDPGDNTAPVPAVVLPRPSDDSDAVAVA